MCTAFIVVAVLGGCGDLATRPAPGPATDAAPAQTRRPAPPPPGATTPEQFDTTTAAQRAEAAAVRPDGARVLGTTIASLGSPTEPGFWLKTPLVTTETPGRVTNPATGKSAAVTLIPIPGPPTAGSRMSLPALRLIGAQLGALTPVEVSVTG
ncbi:hypothetical protein FDT80_05170 [Sulfitobacter sabulilitoris]|uniref:D-galactarate dehydratase n=2 Tax=Sulfitobacter sabulilitoris TaxID=2562655 RepID=A0A5S3QEM0_9RHOB|nr:hypothetical protein FDT80_05170 [Sulfitobacter sabulilitoris]